MEQFSVGCEMQSGNMLDLFKMFSYALIGYIQRTLKPTNDSHTRVNQNIKIGCLTCQLPLMCLCYRKLSNEELLRFIDRQNHSPNWISLIADSWSLKFLVSTVRVVHARLSTGVNSSYLT